MNFKKFISGVSALTIAASAFAGMAVTANAKNTSDGNVQALQDFESYAAGDVTTVVGTSFTDSGSTQIARLTPNTSSGDRIIFNNSKIVQDGTNKYFSTEIKPNNGTRADFYNVGALYFGGRDTTAYNRSLGQTRVFTADVRFYGATQIMLADQTNSTPRMGYKDYLNLNYASGTISWAGTGTKSVDSGWHSIVAIDTAGSNFDETVIGQDAKGNDIKKGVTHTTKLYIDGEYIGSNTTDQNNTNNGANHIGFAAFLAATTTQTKIDVDNLEIFTLAQDSANAAVISVVGGGAASIDPTSETKTLQLSGKVVHNTTDNIDITDFYSTTPTWEINPAVTGVSVDNTGLVTVSNEFDAEANDSATVVYTAGAKSTSLNVNISTERGYVINTTPYASISVDGGVAESTGREGKYQFALDTTGEHSVVISKEGYQTVNTTVTATNGGSTPLALTPNTGIVYQEDFTYVNDNFGGTNGIINVNDGVLKNAFVSSTVTNETVSLPESVNIAGTVTTIRMHANNNARLGYFRLLDNTSSAPMGVYFRGSDKVYYQNSATSGNGVAITSARDTDYHLYQIYMPTTDDDSHRPIVYIDGIKSDADLPRTSVRSIEKLYLAGANGGGSTTIMSVDYIKVESLASGNTEPTATVTVDGTATSYLKGTTVTIPAAAEGFEWHDANDNVVSAGDMVVNENLTLTAVAVTPAGSSAEVTEVSYNQYEAANTAANDQDITAAKILVTVTGSIDTLGLEYNGGSAKYVQNFEGLTNANIVLGAIVPGLVDLTTSSFDAVID